MDRYKANALHINFVRAGYAETICHRKRWFPQIKSGNPHLRSYSERQAINFPIQGIAKRRCICTQPCMHVEVVSGIRVDLFADRFSCRYMQVWYDTGGSNAIT